MIFGQPVPQFDRMRMTSRPARAGFYTPGIPQTGFPNSNFRPFSNSMAPRTAYRPHLPSASGFLRPGVVPGYGSPQASAMAQAAEAPAEPAIVAQQPQAPVAPGANGGAGRRSGRMGFPLIPGVVRAIMRTSVWTPGAYQTEPGIHAGIRKVPATIKAAHPQWVDRAARSAGNYRPGGF